MGQACSCCRPSAVADADCDVHVAVRAGSPVSKLLQSVARSRSPEASSGTTAASGAAVQLTPSAVKVAVVVRPLLPFEQQQAKGATGSSINVQPPNRVSLPARAGGLGVNDAAMDFQFDRVYHAASPAASQALYAEMVRPVIERFCQGFNGTVLAYGQTGSGKTHQMGTAAGVSELRQPGRSAAMIPLALAEVLAHMLAAQPEYESTLRASFIEIYGECLQDLLSPSATSLAGGGGGSGSSSNLQSLRLQAASNSCSGGGGRSGTPRASELAQPALSSASSTTSEPGGISIRETSKGEIMLEGVTEAPITSLADAAAVLEQGHAVRATAAHRLNQSSSRSHAILSLTLEQRARPAVAQAMAPELRWLRSKLHLVDLAGSERAKETGATGQRFAEGVSINKGLLELGNVIKALTEGASRKHVPYRNSKLTRLLRDGLGGNSETLFIACASPADANREHTVSTLRYASRAMAIQNGLQRQALTPEQELAYLRQVVAELSEENARLRAAQAAAAAAGRQAAAG